MIELDENKKDFIFVSPLDWCRIFVPHFVGELSRGDVVDEDDDGEASPLAKFFAHFAANAE